MDKETIMAWRMIIVMARRKVQQEMARGSDKEFWNNALQGLNNLHGELLNKFENDAI